MQLDGLSPFEREKKTTKRISDRVEQISAVNVIRFNEVASRQWHMIYTVRTVMSSGVTAIKK